MFTSSRALKPSAHAYTPIKERVSSASDRKYWEKSKSKTNKGSQNSSKFITLKDYRQPFTHKIQNAIVVLKPKRTKEKKKEYRKGKAQVIGLRNMLKAQQEN